MPTHATLFQTLLSSLSSLPKCGIIQGQYQPEGKGVKNTEPATTPSTPDSLTKIRDYKTSRRGQNALLGHRNSQFFVRRTRLGIEVYGRSDP